MNLSFNIFSAIYSRWSLIVLLSRREIDLRYKSTGLGIVWSAISLLVQLLIYTFIFGFIFNARWPGEGHTEIADYSLILFTGLVCYSVFNETISRAGSVVTAAPYLVKKVIFPVEVLPVAILNAALFHAFVGLILILCVLLFKLQLPPLTIILLPVVLLPLVLFSLGFAWIFAALGVFIKDTQYVSTLFGQVVFYASPILYPLDIIPEKFQWIILLNPLSLCVDMFRKVILFGQTPELSTWLTLTFICYLYAMLAYNFFLRMKREFPNVI